MRTEKVLLSFIAIIIGLGAAAGVFYIYQMTKASHATKSTHVLSLNAPSPTPTAEIANSLMIDSPVNESVTDQKTIKISGKTIPNATIIAQSAIDDEVGKVSTSGGFSLTMPLDNGTNLIHFTVILPDGTEKTTDRIVTFSTESF